jgi:hypothetical protein
VLRRPVESTQYLAIRYTDALAGAGALPSVGLDLSLFDVADGGIAMSDHSG